MYCPFCHKDQSKVIDSRTIESGATIRRRRECTSCGGRFTTVEKALLIVVKRNGLTEPFSRDKVIVGVKRACQGRDVSEDALKRLAQTVEESVRSHGGSQVHANDIGLAILDPLRELDEVAYLRFASVYKSFESAEDFESEIRMMRRQSRLAARSSESHRSRR
ncbi:transcriptional regulator NrdR [Corynebacterium durum]|jgi:transcriptional regulator nrdR|uniref:transcriptional regulator NrdR n=1 Tax=Corynebacterium durum TaxID=61592 RepID=UPI0015C991AF|nr:transcriptional regulator NrdR [Corynebacterium durum]NYI73537.1 transcriptional repressor NrdR [Corynebacterium durum]WJY85261.1 Transcriptional repressor NrdR [Corynebacterium durum]